MAENSDHDVPAGSTQDMSSQCPLPSAWGLGGHTDIYVHARKEAMDCLGHVFASLRTCILRCIVLHDAIN